ncbi:fibro-slime domain-containing protein [uncultured Robinsoniella sp.]|uniref:fibro-slime domain-containing protein n=1 Tax=Robinsoniella sp. TaxID=2496533 RepID=UPI00374ED4AE
MKIRMKKRLTAILLCMAMIVSALGSNGVVLAADKSDNTEIPGTAAEAEMLNETSQAETAAPVESETADAQTEPVVMTEVQTEAASLPETEINTEPAAESIPETEADSEVQSESQEEMQTEMTSETSETALTETESNSEEMQSQYLFENDEMTVEVSLKNVNTVLADAALVVKPIINKTISDNSPESDKAEKAAYDKINDMINEKAEKDAAPIDGFNAYEIYFEKDGVVYQINDEMKVSINFKNAVLPEIFKTEGMNLKATRAQVLQFTADEIEVGKTNVTDLKDKTTVLNCDSDLAVGAVAFESDHVNQFAIAWNGADTTTEYTYDDDQVTVKAVLSEAGILPRGAELKVVPVVEKEELDRVESLLKANVKSEVDTITGFLAYDISFVKDGVEVEPSGDVAVTMDFKEGVKPENAANTTDDNAENDIEQNVALYHFNESKDKDVVVEEVKHASVDVNKKEEVVTTNFQVNSFSIFTLVWTNKNGTSQSTTTQSLNIHIVDKSGNDLLSKPLEFKYETSGSYPNVSSGKINEWIQSEDKKQQNVLENKSFSRAYMTSNSWNGQKNVSNVMIWKNQNNIGWQVDWTNNERYNVKNGDKLYFEYIDKLETVDTVDSAGKGIELNMFKYPFNEHQFTGGVWNETEYGRGVKQGMVQNNLDADGYPVFSTKFGEAIRKSGSNKDLRGTTLKEWFDPQGGYSTQANANHLFLKSVYDESKYFYYSSFDNYAYLNQTGDNAGNFSVYKQIGTPNNSNIFYYQRGNFMPYNEIENGKLSTNKNYYDEQGNPLSQNDARYGEELYKTQGTTYHFGLNMSASFAQPKDGIVDGSPMVFEFNGDDDMWVFIDGVLVLDIGGCHDARSGSINFQTGDVNVQGVTPTNIKALFKAANADMSKFAEGENYFKNYTAHEIKVFYMERGAGASNCKLKFNIPTVPKGSVNITKEIGNINEGSFSDVNFNFKLYVEDENGDVIRNNDSTKYSLVKDGAYTLIDGSKTKEMLTEEDGSFTLKHGQTAQFTQFDMGKKYFVEETDVVQNQYDEFIVNDVQLTTANGSIIEGEDGSSFIIRSQALVVGTDLTVNFQNFCTGDNLQDLVIEKVLTSGSSEDTYELTVTVGGHLFEGEFIRNEAKEDENREHAVKGKIYVKAGDQIRIPKIPSGTSFEVKESNLDELNKNFTKYDKETYEVKNADILSTDGKASGKLLFKKNAEVIVTNTLLLGNLTIKKTIDTANYENGDPIFTFQIRHLETGKMFEYTMRFESGNPMTQEKTFELLPLGTYEVTELETIRYECEGGNIKEAELTKNASEQTVSFKNIRTNPDNYSHTDVVINKFTMDENGNIIITPDRVKQTGNKEN